MTTFKQFLIERPEQVSSSTFKAWFRNSKAVDETGNPLVVYRGDRPNKSRFTGKEDPSVIISGNIFFTDKPSIGKKYIRNPINYANNWDLTPDDLDDTHGLYRTYLSIQNPLVIDAKGEDWTEIPVPPKLMDKYFRGVAQIDDVAATAREMGYDGLIVHNVWDQHGDGTQYVVFNANQIKSAIDNSGNFGATDDFKD
jgi:hypothetical protein